MGDTVNVYGLTSLTYKQYTFHHWPETLDTQLFNITSLAVPISEYVEQKNWLVHSFSMCECCKLHFTTSFIYHDQYSPVDALIPK